MKTVTVTPDWRVNDIKMWLAEFSKPVTRRDLFRRFRSPEWKDAYRLAIKHGEIVECEGAGTKGSPTYVRLSDGAPSIPPYVLAVPLSAWQSFAMRVIASNGDPAKELTALLNG
jgi:hypothetical protein